MRSRRAAHSAPRAAARRLVFKSSIGGRQHHTRIQLPLPLVRCTGAIFLTESESPARQQFSELNGWTGKPFDPVTYLSSEVALLFPGRQFVADTGQKLFSGY